MLPDSKTDAIKKSKDLSPLKKVFTESFPLTKTRINEPEPETTATPSKIVNKEVTAVNGAASETIDRTRFDVPQPDKT